MENWKRRTRLRCKLYCKYKKPCYFKKIKKSRYRKGLYYVLCLNLEGCNQQSIYPKTIDLRKGVKHGKKKMSLPY